MWRCVYLIRETRETSSERRIREERKLQSSYIKIDKNWKQKKNEELCVSVSVCRCGGDQRRSVSGHVPRGAICVYWCEFVEDIVAATKAHDFMSVCVCVSESKRDKKKDGKKEWKGEKKKKEEKKRALEERCLRPKRDQNVMYVCVCFAYLHVNEVCVFVYVNVCEWFVLVVCVRQYLHCEDTPFTQKCVHVCMCVWILSQEKHGNSLARWSKCVCQRALKCSSSPS